MRKPARKPDGDYRQLILEKIEKQHARLIETIDALGGAGADRVTAVMAHLTAWEQRMMRRISGIVADKPGPNELAVDEFNARVEAATKPRRRRLVRSDFDESYRQVLEFIRDLPDQTLARREVRLLIGYNTHGHYRWAIDKLRRRPPGA